jgi:hypothetical protein
MSSCVNPAKVDDSALVMQATQKSGEISLPGQFSAAQTNSPKPLEITPAVVPASNMVIPPVAGPSVDKYSAAQIASFKEMYNEQGRLINTLYEDNARWLKTNVEEWKVQVQFNKKKSDAGVTDDSPLGTSTDPVALEAWRLIYNGTPDPNNWLWKQNENNNVRRPPEVEARKKYKQMNFEFHARVNYGKYPYTFLAAQGQRIPEIDQFTYFDSTK